MFELFKKKAGPLVQDPTPEPPRTFQNGDIVRYNSGSPAMVVEARTFNHEEYDTGREVFCCIWFSQVQDKFKEIWIPVESLHLLATRENAQAWNAGQKVGGINDN